MFPSGERIRSAYFESVIKKGRMTHSSLFSCSYLKDEKKVFAVVASKKVSKLAVIRNKNKRRVREAVKTTLPSLKDGAYAVFIKKNLSALPYREICEEIATLLIKAA